MKGGTGAHEATGIMRRLTKWPLIVALVLATGAVLAVGLYTAGVSRDEHLIMNLAGRQRMLSQAFASKHVAAVLGGGDPSTRTELEALAHQFEDGLQALRDGGSVTYGDSTVSLPRARDPAFRAALEDVRERWDELRSTSTDLLAGGPGDPNFDRVLAGFEQTSVEAVESMDRAVRVYEQVADARATLSALVQWALALLGAAALTLALLGARRAQLLTAQLGRQRAEEALHEVAEAARLHSAALQAAANAVAITDRNGLIQWANTAYERLTGYTPAEVLGLNPRILKSGKHDEAFYKELWDTILAGGVWHGELINKRKDGTEYTEEQTITPVCDDRGEITHFIAIKQDITQRKRTEEELKELTADLERRVATRTKELAASRDAALNMMADAEEARKEAVQAEEALQESSRRLLRSQQVARMGFLDWNLRTNQIELSDEILRLYGLDPEKKWTTPELISSVVHPDDLELVRLNLEAAVRGEKEYAVDHRVVRPDGELLWVHADAELLHDDEGNPERLLGTVIEITERKRAEQELERHREHLEELVVERTCKLTAVNKELEAFAYSVSHDLRGPLRAIDGFSRILLEEHTDQLDTEGRRLLNVVRENSGLMGQLIEDILELSRVGRRPLEQSSVDMNEAVAAAIDALELQYPDRQLGMVMQDMPPVIGDRPLIQQVWANLISNAVKFTANIEGPIIEVCGSVENGENVYAVRDNGAGFDMRYVGKLFSLFQRLHGREEFEGTGVGLAIVQRIVERHGGRVWAEGKVNEGATFYFALPSEGGT